MSALPIVDERPEKSQSRARPHFKYIDHRGVPPIEPLENLLIAEERPLGPYTVLDMETYFSELEYPVELHNGWFVWRKMTDIKERTVVGTIQDMLSIPARKAGFGQMVPDGSELRIDEGNDIIPDAALISWKLMEKHVILHGPNKRPLLTKGPELVIESRSPSNTRREDRRKREKYFSQGTLIVWDVDEQNKRIYVYRSEDRANPTELGVNDLIDCKPLLPDWQRRVADIFDEHASADAVIGDAIDEWRQEGHAEGHAEGRREGEDEKALEIATALLDILDDETISKKTGLTVEQVSTLRSS